MGIDDEATAVAQDMVQAHCLGIQYQMPVRIMAVARTDGVVELAMLAHSRRHQWYGMVETTLAAYATWPSLIASLVAARVHEWERIRAREDAEIYVRG